MRPDDLDWVDRDDLDSLDIVERVMALEETGIDPLDLDDDAEPPLVRSPLPRNPHGSDGATAKPED